MINVKGLLGCVCLVVFPIPSRRRDGAGFRSRGRTVTSKNLQAFVVTPLFIP
jgi:hypothetical protein